MIYAFIVSLLGLSIAFRISKLLITRDLLSKSDMTKIGTAYFCTMILVLTIADKSRFALWSAVFAPQALIASAALMLVRARARAFRARFREALTIVHLKMKAGRSFRQSLDETINESAQPLRSKLSGIRSVVVFSQQKPKHGDRFVSDVIDEFTRIDRNPHAAMRRLAVFRDKLRVEDDFRRKSGQALAQIRAQSLVMCGLYLAVALFVGHHFGWRANREIFIGSSALFIVGLMWLWLGGRRMKWKV